MRARALLVPSLALALAPVASPQEGTSHDHAAHQGHAPPSGATGPGPLTVRARAPLGWTFFPILVEVPPAGRPERNAATVALGNLDVPSVRIQAPARAGPFTQREVGVEQGRARVERPGSAGGYHWVTATVEHADAELTASTVIAFADAGPSPRALLAASKAELEVVPDPLPREHAAYRETETWRFLVRFRGRPLPGARVTLETERGSRSPLLADAAGGVTVLFPRDLSEGQAGAGPGRGRARGRFVLAAEHAEGGRRWVTAFNWWYGADPERDRSRAAGLAFGLGGMLLALPLLLRRRGVEEARHA